MKRFAAEVIFTNPDLAADAAVVLADIGLDCEVDADAADTESAYVWTMVTGTTELDEGDVGCWVSRIVWPLGGDVASGDTESRGR
ncbi:MAG: hypothetical protein C5B58_16350 [Acidobacteria bacterium]|nr:MAG: hypothetical protein C5B58_16350 [Acidobacteriota bacterium]